MSFISDLSADIAIYTQPSTAKSKLVRFARWCSMTYKHPGFWAVFAYRVGRALKQFPIPIIKQLLLLLYYIFWYPSIRFTLGIEIPLSCQIGPGLAIWHYGGIIFGGGLIAGSNLSVNSGVMIARKHQLSDIATIGDNVSIHAHALILCESIGNNCVIGAGSVVTKNVPENTTVAGNPAKPIIPKTRADVDQTPPS